MKKLTYIMTVIFLLVIFILPLFAQRSGKLAQVGMAFLDIPVGSRAAGLGEAYVSVGDDPNAIFWNPAGIALVKSNSLMFNYNAWIADITHISGAFCYKIKNLGVFGVSFISMDYGNITGTRIADNEEGYIVTGNLTPSEYALGIAFAQRVSSKFSYGIHIKYVHQDLGTSLSGSTEETLHEVQNTLGEVAFDFGTFFYTGFKDLRVAMSVRNFSREIAYREESFAMPLTFSFGMSMNILSLFDIDEKHSLTLAVDALHPRDYPERINFGCEYSLSKMIFIRGGYKFVTDEEGLTAGIGLEKKIGPTNIRINYSYSHFGLFNQVHRTSMGFAF